MTVRWILSLLILTGVSAAQALELSLDESQAGTGGILVANGELGLSDAGTIAKILNKRADEGKRTIVLFTSHGGALEVVRGIGDAILKASETLKSKHGSSNIFAVNIECSSACTLLTAYLTSKRNAAALEMVMDGEAIFGIHGPRGGKEKQDKQITAYLAFGAKAGWVGKNQANLRQTKMTELKAATLCRERTMIIPPDSCYDRKKSGDLVEDLKKRLGIEFPEP
jgi:hypothetical protein